MRSGAHTPELTWQQLHQVAADLNAAERFIDQYGPDSLVPMPVQSGVISPRHKLGSTPYLKCVLNASGLGFFVGLFTGGGSAAADVLSMLRAKHWNKAAWRIIGIVGKGAIKGSVAGFVTVLAGAAVWCATPWAQ